MSGTSRTADPNTNAGTRRQRLAAWEAETLDKQVYFGFRSHLHASKPQRLWTSYLLLHHSQGESSSGELPASACAKCLTAHAWESPSRWLSSTLLSGALCAHDVLCAYAVLCAHAVLCAYGGGQVQLSNNVSISCRALPG
eukprot:2230714-Rhodomonas_salina.1